MKDTLTITIKKGEVAHIHFSLEFIRAYLSVPNDEPPNSVKEVAIYNDKDVEIYARFK